MTPEARLGETRTFPAPAALTAQANLDASVSETASADPIAFWERAAERLQWATPWHTAHTWAPPVEGPDGLSVPKATWFDGGTLNVAVNCVDRHVDAGRGEKVALHFEGEPGDRIAVTYADLQRRVAQAANGLTALGIVAGDRVVVYLPVLIETVVIALAPSAMLTDAVAPAPLLMIVGAVPVTTSMTLTAIVCSAV